MNTGWIISEDQFDPQKLHHGETVFTSGNGYLCSRGAFEEGYPGESQAVFLHGVFDDMPISFTELANAPDWMELDIIICGERFSLAKGELLAYERTMDLRNGLVMRDLTWKSPQGRTSRLVFERFASLANQHLLCQRVTVTAQTYAGGVEVRSGLNCETDNQGLKHWRWLDQGSTGKETVWLKCQTRATKIDVSLAARMVVDSPGIVQRAIWDVHSHPTLTASCSLAPGQTATFEKTTALFTARDVADPRAACLTKLSSLSFPSWNSLWSTHTSAWEKEWQQCDVTIEGDEEAQIALRFSIFQLLIAAPRHDEYVNIGAKTLSGYGYRGHSFWDTEIFMLPMFTYTRPEIARNLLSYRWHTLPAARRKATANGYQGAQYAWESAGGGDEVTPSWVHHFADPSRLVRIWTGDIEIHISADIPYAILQYWRATADDDFLRLRGAEIILETARFWANRAEWDEQMQRFEYNDVIGPDENHEHVNNNAYTNYQAQFVLNSALCTLSWLQERFPEDALRYQLQLNLTSTELERWKHVSQNLYLSLDPSTNLVEQFEGYFRLKDIRLSDYEPRSESMQQILGIEGANYVQIIKQPDVLMLLFLLREQFNPAVFEANYNYYTPRTDYQYGSSLGPSIQAIMSCEMGDIEKAYELFMLAGSADLRDVRGNAGDGIHAASAGGLWQAAVFGFAGLRFMGDRWEVKPRLPSHWKRLAFRFYWKGQPVQIDLHPE
jgi:trehalose/maltose hydrolase-like predicted phosphorylase